MELSTIKVILLYVWPFSNAACSKIKISTLFPLKSYEKKFYQHISGLEALEVMLWEGRKQFHLHEMHLLIMIKYALTKVDYRLFKFPLLPSGIWNRLYLRKRQLSNAKFHQSTQTGYHWKEKDCTGRVKKKFKRLVGCYIKSMGSIFKTELLIYHSKANLDEKILFDKFTHHLDPEIRKMSVRGLYGNRIFHVPFWSMIYVVLKFTL